MSHVNVFLNFPDEEHGKDVSSKTFLKIVHNNFLLSDRWAFHPSNPGNKNNSNKLKNSKKQVVITI